MAYEAKHNNSNPSGNSTSPMDQKQQEQEASKNLAKTAAKGAATYFAGPAGGQAVDAIANTKAGQKVLDTAGKNLNKIPGMGKKAKQLDDSGAIKAADKAIDVAGGAQGGTPGTGNTPGSMPNQLGKNQPTSNSMPDTNNFNNDDYKTFGDRLKDLGGEGLSSGLGGIGGKKKPSSFFDDSEENQEQNPMDGLFEFNLKIDIKTVIILILPIIALLLLVFVIFGAVGGGVADFNDALGASDAAGMETGDIEFTAYSKDAQKFYERVNEVKLGMQENGKIVDALKIAAVYHIMNSNNNEYDYDYMTTIRIYEIAKSMFNGNIYDEETFKNNLANDIFLKYFPDESEEMRKQYAEDVFDYIERYYSFIGIEGNVCNSNVGSCNYDIKGFYIPGAGNISKQMQVSNLMVRLMECGSPYGNGSYTTPINQSLVPFEEYVAGVAYAEIGPSASMEALKAQMVIARSFALARPTGMGNSLGKKLEQENGQWVLQISSCVADQVFCNINEGCSYMGGGDGQGGIVKSGHVNGAIRTRNALAMDHNIRTAMAATSGEVLVNDQGYIIQAGYLSDVQNQISSLANQGMNYKQILLQVYNSGSRKYGAADIQAMSCNTAGSSNCVNAASGPYASWKQKRGPWTQVPLGNSSHTIYSAGCLVTSVSILIAKSGVPTTIPNFNPGTFVEHLNQNGGFSGANYLWVTPSAPTFNFVGKARVSLHTREQKLNTLKELLNQGYYVVAEVMGPTGQHWVAIDYVAGDTIVMMDPGSNSTDMWAQYNWRNTSTFAYFKVG